MKVWFELRYVVSDGVSGRLGTYETKRGAIAAGEQEIELGWYVVKLTREVVFVKGNTS